MTTDKTPLFHYVWRGENPPPAKKPEISTEDIKGLGEGLKGFGELVKVFRELSPIIQGGVKMEKPSDVMKEANELLKQADEYKAKMSPGDKSQKPKYSVLADGTIVPDPEGEFERLTDALLASSNLKQKSTPAYYFQDPETGDYKEAKGPVVVRQPSQPIIYKVDAVTGEVEELKPGEPIVIKQSAPPETPSGKTWMIHDADGTVEEYEPGKPVVVKMPQPPTQPVAGKTWMIHDADGTVEEYEPGKPIVIKQPPAPVQPAPTIQPTAQIIGLDGKPVQLTRDQFDMQIKWLETEHNIKKAERLQDSIVGLVDKLKENVPAGIKALERAAKMREQQAPQQPAAPQEHTLPLNCPSCHQQTTLTLRAVQKAGNKFQCAWCGETHDVVFEGQAPPAPPVPPEGPK